MIHDPRFRNPYINLGYEAKKEKYAQPFQFICQSSSDLPSKITNTIATNMPK